MDINLGNLSDTDGLEIASKSTEIKSYGESNCSLQDYDLPVYRHEAKKIGISGFLNKNISPDDLISSFNSCFVSGNHLLSIRK